MLKDLPEASPPQGVVFMRRFRVLAFLALLPTIGYSNATWIPDDERGADCDQHLDRVTEVEDSVPGGLSAGDWASIQAAHEAGRYAATRATGGFQARNPGQRWVTYFDGRGFRTEPDSGGWSWGLELRSYGFAGSEQVVTEATSVSAEGQRVAYEWDVTLEEWYVNDTRGLEHGYIVHRRPVSDGGDGASPLTFTLAVRGGLCPVIDAGGRGVSFSDSTGAKILTYTGLTVVDAEGRALSARFERVGEGLQLSIDERAARYPLTIDPVAQQAYLKASNTDPDDRFGSSVSVSGNTVVVGAFRESSSATGVNGDQNDNSGWRSGAAYVFVRNGASWSQEAYLKASNTDNQDFFGTSVSVSGDTIVVGANGEDSTATGVNSGQLSNGAYYSGAAYVFVRNGTSWSQEAYIKASNTDPDDRFGSSVSVSGDTVVVGARFEASNATGVNGDQGNNLAAYSGAAYVFVRNGTTWSQQAYLKASNTGPWDFFGSAVALSGDTLVVGAYDEASSATGVNGDQSDNSAYGAGAAYVFVRNGRIWSQQAYLKASNTDVDDLFSWDLSVSGDTIVVGALGESSSATGVNGDQSDNSAMNAGAAYVFVRNGTSWSQQAYLKASNTDASDQFGGRLSVRGDTVAIGVGAEDSSATGINGDQSDNSASAAGAAYVFARSGMSWNQQLYLKASNTDYADHFGCVALSGDTLIVGAPGERSAATGVNGDQDDNSASGAGAAYVFEIGPPGVGYCFGDVGSGTPCPCNNDNDGSLPGSGCANGVFASGAQLTGSGVASVTSDTLVLHTAHQEPSELGLYFGGITDLSPGLIWGDGLRCVGGAVKRLQVRFADGAGFASTTISLGSKGGVNAGDTRYYQCWYRNPLSSPCGYQFNTSNGYVITWIP